MILGTSFSARTATCDFSKKKKNNPVSMYAILPFLSDLKFEFVRIDIYLFIGKQTIVFPVISKNMTPDFVKHGIM